MREGWKIRTLEEICDKIFAGGDKPKENFSSIKTKEYSVPIFANGEKNKGLYGFTNIAKVVKPSITVSARGTIGYSEIRNEPFFPIVRLIVLTPNNEVVNLKYLQYLVSSMDFKNSGTSIPQLTVPMIKKYVSAIPPLEEQQQIVAILDKAFLAIDQAKANIEKNIANAKELFQSKLNNIFSQKGEGWEEKSLGEVCRLVGGGTPSKKIEEYYNGKIPWATVRDMNSDKLHFTDHKISELGLKKSSSKIIPKNHVIIATRVGLGKVCILQQNTAINQDLKGIIPKPKFKILNEFIFWWYKSIANKVIEAGTGATVQGVKLTFVNKLTFPLVKIEEQNRIVGILNQFSNDIEKLENFYASKLSNLEELKKSMLQKAFAGELTEKAVVV